jgi:hypothetical protein
MDINITDLKLVNKKDVLPAGGWHCPLKGLFVWFRYDPKNTCLGVSQRCQSRHRCRPNWFIL